jgi:hypothetical protein
MFASAARFVKWNEETPTPYRPPPLASINRSDSRLTKILAWYCSPQPRGAPGGEAYKRYRDAISREYDLTRI